MIRARFKADLHDPRPVQWPIRYPYWITGSDDQHSTIVAYVEDYDAIFDLWPEAEQVEYEQTSEIVFSARFPKPEWFIP